MTSFAPVASANDGSARVVLALRVIRDLLPVLRLFLGLHHQATRIGLAINAGLEAIGLWLQAVAKTGLSCVNSDARKAARKPRLAPIQRPRSLRQAIFIAVAARRDALFSADALRLALCRGRRNGRRESGESADDQYASEREDGMHPTVGHGGDSNGPLPDQRPADGRGFPFQPKLAVLRPQSAPEKRLSLLSHSTRHRIVTETSRSARQQSSLEGCASARSELDPEPRLSRLVALRQPQDALGHVAQDELLAHRRDARDQDLAQETFHVKLLGVAVAAMGEDGTLAGLVGSARPEILGGVGLGAALLAVVVEPGRLEGHQVGRLERHPALGQGMLDRLVLADRPAEHDALLGVLRGAGE